MIREEPGLMRKTGGARGIGVAGERRGNRCRSAGVEHRVCCDLDGTLSLKYGELVPKAGVLSCQGDPGSNHTREGASDQKEP